MFVDYRRRDVKYFGIETDTRAAPYMVCLCLVALTLGDAAVAGELTPEAASAGIGRPLTDTEIEILEAVRSGKRRDIVAEGRNELGTSLIRWLCTDAKGDVPKQIGIHIQGVTVADQLDLSNIDVDFPLTFENSSFRAPLILSHSSVFSLGLVACKLQELDAGGLATVSDVDISRTNFSGECRFFRSNVGGSLQCRLAKFENAGIAIDVSYSQIEGNAGFVGAVLHGELDLERTRIADSLRLDDATLKMSEDAPKGRTDAFDGDYLNVLGTIYCTGDFRCGGRFNLTNARIEENFDCSHATFSSANEGGVAISASGAYFGRNVYFRYGFKANGTVNLTGARIGGILGCLDGSFKAPKGNRNAINAPRLRVADSVHFLNDFKCHGTIDLENAEIGKNLDCRSLYEVEFINGLIPKRYNHQTGETSEFRCHGLLDLQGAKIGGAFRIDKAGAATEFCLDLRWAQIGVLEDNEESWPDDGGLHLDGLVYGAIQESPNNLSRICWIRLQPEGSFRSQPYTQLAMVLNSLGDEKSARAVLIAREGDPFRVRESGLAEWFWWHVVARYTIGYGYAPWRAFWIGLVIVLVGWLVFQLGFQGPPETRLIVPTDSEFFFREPTSQALNRYPAFNALVFSIDVFTPIVDLRQASRWFPSPRRGKAVFFGITTGGMLRALAWLFIAAGWILSTLLAVSLTGVIQD